MIASLLNMQIGDPIEQQVTPLTGREREVGCNGYGAIMSGRCP